MAVIAPVLVLAAGVAGLAAGYELSRSAEHEAIDVVGVAAAETRGGWSQKEIRVKASAKVKLRQTSHDAAHGFLIPDLGLQAGPILLLGDYTEVTIALLKPVKYRFSCKDLCSHRHGAVIGMTVTE